MRLIVHFEGGNKRVLGNVDLAELTHFLFAFFLLVEQFTLAAHIATIINLSLLLGLLVFNPFAD